MRSTLRIFCVAATLLTVLWMVVGQWVVFSIDAGRHHLIAGVSGLDYISNPPIGDPWHVEARRVQMEFSIQNLLSAPTFGPRYGFSLMFSIPWWLLLAMEVAVGCGVWVLTRRRRSTRAFPLDAQKAG